MDFWSFGGGIVFYPPGLTYSQSVNYEEYFDYSDPAWHPDKTGTNYTPYGGVFTPKGNLRALIIFAQINEIDGNSTVWDYNLAPDFVNSATSRAPEIIFHDNTDFTTYASQEYKNLSRFYNQMSRGQFTMYGDVLSHPNGTPVKIKVSLSGASGWGALNARVIQKMMDSLPNFDWSPYDQRTNWPNYQSDNSLSTPDGKPDYVVICYRYSNGINTNPAYAYVKNWPGSSGGYSVLDGLSGINYNGYTFDYSGFTLCSGGTRSASEYLNILAHEIAHELYDCPHIMGANTACGDFFYVPTAGWGMMSSIGKLTSTSNAFESWQLGWNELITGGNQANSNIQSASDLINNGIYTMRDFVTYGDAIRIKIPNSNDYLWIENHQLISDFDFKPWAGADLGAEGELVPDFEEGIYMYIESVSSSRSEVPSVFGDANKIKVLSASGNWDYWHSETCPPRDNAIWWGNWVFNFQRLTENPLSGANPLSLYIDDYPTNPTIPGSNSTITHTYNGNGGGSLIEGMHLVRQSNSSYSKMLFENLGGVNYEGTTYFNHRYDGFRANDEISLSGIFPVVNNPLFNRTGNKFNEKYLNGLSVKILSYNSVDKTYQVQIKFDDYTVRENKRWTGYFTLKDNTSDANPDLIVAQGKTLTIDKSGTPNRDTKLNGVFVNPTVFTCDVNSHVEVQQNAIINVINESQIVFKTGSTLKLKANAQLIADNTAKIKFEPGVNIILEENAKIWIKAGAIFEMGGANIVAGLNSKIEIFGSFIMPNNSEFAMSGSGLLKFAGTSSFGTGGSFVLEGNDINTSLLTVSQDILNIKSSEFTLRNGKVYFETTNGQIKCDQAGTVLTTENVLFTGLSTQKYNNALYVVNPSQMNVSNCIFEHVKTAVFIQNLATNPAVQFSSCSFNDFRTGISVNGGAIDMDGCSFANGTTGLSAINMANASSISSGMFSGLTTGISFKGLTSSTLAVSYSTATNNTDGLVAEGPATITTNCCNFGSISNAGVYLKSNATLVSDNCTFDNSKYPVLAYQAKTFDLHNGYNTLKCSSGGLAMSGSFCATTALTVDAFRNRWNSLGIAPRQTTDYNLKDCYTTPRTITLRDLYPQNSYTECDVPGGLMGMQSFGAVNTALATELENKLNEASALMEINNPQGNDLQAFEKLHKIVTTLKYYQTETQRALVDKAYTHLRQTLGNIANHRPENLGTYATKAMQAAQFVQGKNQGDYRVKFNIHIDRVHIQLLEGKYNQAIQMLTQMQSWTQVPDEAYRAKELCLAQQMKALNEGTLSMDDPEALMAECECNTGDAGSDNAGSSTGNQETNPVSIVVTPNPTTGNAGIQVIIPENTLGAVLFIHDQMGQLKQQFSLQAGQNTLTTGKSILGTGVFNLSVFVNGTKIGESRLSVND